MNNLPSTPQKCQLESYVDDSKVFLSFPIKSIKQAVKNLEEDLHTKKCCKNYLLINPGKMLRLPSDTSLNLLGKTLEPVTAVKDLGVSHY